MLNTSSQTAILILGSNLGDRQSLLNKAINQLKTLSHTQIIHCSPFIETAAIGPKQPDYLNVALEIETDLTPLTLLAKTQYIEQVLGRVHQPRWQARLIDIDILTFGKTSLQFEACTLPHPALNTRPYINRLLQELQTMPNTFF